MKDDILEYICLHFTSLIVFYYWLRHRSYPRKRAALFVLRHIRPDF